MKTDFEKLWKLVSNQFHTREYSVHGPEHWRRVERNAFLLATRTGAEIEVVRLRRFANYARYNYENQSAWLYISLILRRRPAGSDQEPSYIEVEGKNLGKVRGKKTPLR